MLVCMLVIQAFFFKIWRQAGKLEFSKANTARQYYDHYLLGERHV
jgi:hypothetical protein